MSKRPIMKNLLFAFLGLLLIASCRKDTPKSGSSDASVSVISLGDENLAATVPADGATAVFANAPRSIASNLKAVKVNITAADKTSVKIGAAAFVSGSTVDFTNPVAFMVTAEDGTAKTYTVSITAYNAASNPYGIYTVKHLADAANALTASFLLKNNIDLPNADAAGATATGISDYATAGWLPLDSLMGTFDGGNFSINNFYVKREAEKVGLFAALGKGGIIKNLSVNGVGGTAAAGSGYIRKQCTGILAGYSTGTIEKCYVAGNVSSSSVAGGLVGYNKRGTVSNSHAAGGVSAVVAGGLAGISFGNINNCYATGSVSSSYHGGGLVGLIEKSSIDDSYATGNVSVSSSDADANPSAGGLVGYGSRPGAISDSYATGNVSVTSAGAASAGGLAGMGGSTISNSYATGVITAATTSSSGGTTSSAGGLVGYYFGHSISNSYATGSASASAVAVPASAGGLVGYYDNSRGAISNSYATGNVSSSSSSSSSSSGGLMGGETVVGHETRITCTNCYRNSNAVLKENDANATSDDASVTGIALKTKAEMQTDVFKGNLNGTSGAVWGRNDSKNDKLPFIIGVGVGK